MRIKKRHILLPTLFIVPLAWGQQPEFRIEEPKIQVETEIVEESAAESDEHSHDEAETDAKEKSSDLLDKFPKAALDLARKIDKEDVFEFSKKLFVENDDKWEEIKDQLEESGIDEKTMKAVRKALEKSEKGAMKFIDKAMIVGPEGAKDVKLFFQSLGGELAENEVARRLWHQMREALLEAGVTEEQIGKAEAIWTEELAPANYKIGVRCAEISPALRAQLPLEGDLGLVVEEVFEGSPAEQAGLQAYDVLIHANGEALMNVGQLVAGVQASGKKGEPVHLTYLRRGTTHDVELRPEREKSEAADAVVDWVEKHHGRVPHLENIPHLGSLFRPGKPSKPDNHFGEAPAEAIEALEDQVKALTDTIEALRKEFDARDEAHEAHGKHEAHHPDPAEKLPPVEAPAHDHE